MLQQIMIAVIEYQNEKKDGDEKNSSATEYSFYNTIVYQLET